MRCQPVNEMLFTIGQGEPLPSERDYIVAHRVKALKTNVSIHAQIMKQHAERLTSIGTADIMHARIEYGTIATETLQATTYLRGLLEHRDLISILGKNNTTRQATKSTTDDDTLLHLFFSR